VFVQNFAPGAALRLGLDAKALVAKYPRLVAVDIAGYGQDTAYAQMRAYDMLVQAESGICAVTGTPDTPVKVGVSIADIGTGMNAHAAILEALLERGRTGRGKAIEMTLFDSMAEWMTVPLLHYMQAGKVTPRVGLSHAVIQPYSLYDCADGQVVIAIQNHAEWERFCTGVLQRPELIADPRFATNPLRLKNRDTLDAEIATVLTTLTRARAIERLERATVAWGKVSTLGDVAQHPGLRLIDVDLPNGTFRCMAPPLRPNLERRSVPALGQNNAAIRAEFAG
jgi:crotonobetainyl-CoA:carnitine CoA-transferase CaiB-like acyl-CoA transferase